MTALINRRFRHGHLAAPVLALVVLLSCVAFGAQRYPVRGMVVGVNQSAKTFTASIDAIPNYMQAMTMPFDVRAVSDLVGVTPGAIVTFTLVVDNRSSYATDIRIVRYQNVEQDPFTANRLSLLNELVRGTAVKALTVGETVPDFALTDQKQHRVRLSDFGGKVVVMNFIYTSCPLPNYCLRLANNFNVLQKRFRRELGPDLVLLTVTFDPTHDTPEKLASYAAMWEADPAKWHFLTGTEADVQRVCGMFGVQAYANEGLLDHTLHTVLLDRQRKLVANIEGNQFTAAQLGDLAATLLR